MASQSGARDYGTGSDVLPPKIPTKDAHNPCSSQLRSRESPEIDTPNEPPVGQLIILALISLAEQTAMNSISPYLPQMVSSFPEVGSGTVGMYVGLVASGFALAQCISGYFWGRLSDWIGRKPVIILGTVLTILCFLAFGFCTSLWSAVAVQAMMGLVNGNSAVVSTCLGELTNKGNQGRVFAYLPVVYGIGAVTGPVIGGILVQENIRQMFPAFKRFPFLLPNLFSVLVLLVGLAVCITLFKESLEAPTPLFAAAEAVNVYFSADDDDADPDFDTSSTGITPVESDEPEQVTTSPGFSEDGQGPDTLLKMFSRGTGLLLITYTLFSFSNVSYASILPIFAATNPPAGRSLSPHQIGLLLSFSAAVAIVFQVAVYNKLRSWMGNRASYQVSLVMMMVAFLITPWVGYKQDPISGLHPLSIWIEFGLVLILRTIASVGGLTSALILITNSAPCPAVLGRLNGLAQTLSAAGRAVAPVVSGSIFSLATRTRMSGDVITFTLLGSIPLLGFLFSIGIRDPTLEDDKLSEHVGEDTPLLQDIERAPRRSELE